MDAAAERRPAQRPTADLLVARGFDVNADSDFAPMLVRACRGDISHLEPQRIKTRSEQMIVNGHVVHSDKHRRNRRYLHLHTWPLLQDLALLN